LGEIAPDPVLPTRLESVDPSPDCNKVCHGEYVFEVDPDVCPLDVPCCCWLVLVVDAPADMPNSHGIRFLLGHPHGHHIERLAVLHGVGADIPLHLEARAQRQGDRQAIVSRDVRQHLDAGRSCEYPFACLA
jgi:hypothetical protein